MYFFPVEIFFHLNFNAYFFTSVSTGFYFRSFQPRFYEFIKFRFSRLNTGFSGVQSFNKFRDLMFPTIFFNPTRFTNQFSWYILETSDLFVRPAWLNFSSYDLISYKLIKSLVFHNFFDEYFPLAFSSSTLASPTSIIKPHNHYFESKFFLIDFRYQNVFFLDFSFFHKFDTLFSSKTVSSFFKRMVFKTSAFDFIYPISNSYVSQSNLFNNAIKSFTFFYPSFCKFFSCLFFRFKNVESDFFKIPKFYRFISEFAELDRSEWDFERSRLSRFFVPPSPLVYAYYKRRKNVNITPFFNVFIKKNNFSSFFYKKNSVQFFNVRNRKLFIYFNTSFALSTIIFFKTLSFKLCHNWISLISFHKSNMVSFFFCSFTFLIFFLLFQLC